MPADWHLLSDETQLTVARAALDRAAATIALQAEDLLADEIDNGVVRDTGGADALRLLAAVVRGAAQDPLAVAGRC